MSYPVVIVRLGYIGEEDPRHPVAIIQMKDHMEAFLFSKIQEAGFFVEIEEAPTPIFTVTAKTRTPRYELTVRLRDIIIAAHDEYCGFINTIRTLVLQGTLPALKNVRHTPDEDAPLVRLGALRCSREVAVDLEDYDEAGRLQRQINQLVVA